MGAIEAGTTLKVEQSVPQTAGAAAVFAQLWAA